MDISLASWFVIVLALLAANLPFVNERLLAIIPFGRPVKPFWARLLELAVLYALVGTVARFLEASMGNAFPQTWEFFAITGCLFIVLAYPGFVYRYLRKQHD